MLRWLSLLFIGLAAFSLATASTVHAVEPVADPHCVGVEAGHSTETAPGDQEPSEKSVPVAHASCHAPAVALPSSEIEVGMVHLRKPALLSTVALALPCQAIAPDIRPPIA